MSEGNLLTSYLFHDQEYLIKMNVVNSLLEISVTDKQTGEEWQCSYDHAYIENLTHKTGNFKQFKIFVTMLKSGLLKTSKSISLDLLTYEDLEALRTRRIKNHGSRMLASKHSNNRRYLILVYNVEFDRIIYPLPLEYCGPPDPILLQETIRHLKAEIVKLQEQTLPSYYQSDSTQISRLKKCIEELMDENMKLKDSLYYAHEEGINKSKNNTQKLEAALNQLEKSVAEERKTHQRIVSKLKEDNSRLLLEVDRLRRFNFIAERKVNQLPRRSPTRSLNEKTIKGKNIDSFTTLYKNPLVNRFHRNPSNEKYRPVSPRRTKSEEFIFSNQHAPSPLAQIRNRRPISRSPIQSRGTSMSSQKNSDCESDDANFKYKTQNNRSRNLERRRTANRSRSTSASSVYKSGSSHVLQMKIKSSEEEFKSIESRIQKLQKILQENVNM